MFDKTMDLLFPDLFGFSLEQSQVQFAIGVLGTPAKTQSSEIERIQNHSLEILVMMLIFRFCWQQTARKEK